MLAAVLLVFIVIIGILGMRTALLVGVAIPGSFLMGILLIGSFGSTINMMVLFALIMAVGMLVDGAIVVTEMADRRMAEGESRFDAYSRAAIRMSWPIIASTCTTLAAFVPLALWPGTSGEFMKFLPATLIVGLVALYARAEYIPAAPDRHVELAEARFDLDVGPVNRWFSAWSIGDGQAFAVIAADPSNIAIPG